MKPSYRNPLLRNFVLAATICLSLGQATHAASVYWDTNGNGTGSGPATGTWGTNTYWTTTEAGNVATTGTLPTANDDVIIAAGTTGTTGTITVDTAKVAGSITIQEPAANPGVTISGGTSLTLGGGSSASKGLFVSGNGTHTVSTPLILNGANTIQNSGTGTLTVSGGVTGTGDLTLRNNNTGATGINLSTAAVNNTGTISNTGTNTGFVILGNANAATGAGGLEANVTSFSQDSANSPFEFRNANNSNYAGNYNINAGTLHWGGTNATIATGTITATNAASVINLGATSGTAAATMNVINNAVSGKLNNNILVRAGSTGTKTIGVALTGSGVTFSTTGTITLDDSVTLNPNTSAFLNPNGLIQDGANGAKGITKAGPGTVTLNLAHSYSGATSVTAGPLILTGSAGALANTSGIAITGGTLQLNNTGAANNTNRIPDTAPIAITGGTLEFKNDSSAATAFSETIAVTANAGGTITASQAAADGSSALTIGSFTRNPGAALSFAGTGLGVDARNRILFSTAPATLNGIIPWATYGNTGFAGYDGTNGIVAVTPTDIDAQGSTIADDSTSNLRIFADGSGAAIALGAATTSINSLVQANTVVAPPTIDTAGKTLRVSSVLLSSAANTKGLTIGSAANDGTLTAGTTGGELLLINSSASALTVNAVIANNGGASSVTKAGTGDATFAGNNTYSGATTLTGGVVTAAHDNAFGSGTVTIANPTKRLVVANGVTISNAITFNGGGEGLRGVFENSATGGNATIAGPITISGNLAGGGHFASTTGGTLTISGAITATGSNPVVRTGTVIMSGVGTASNYATFNAAAGVIRLGADDALLPTATLDLGNSGNSNFDLNDFNQTLAGITRSGNTTTIGNASTTGDSTLTLTGTSTYSGTIANTLIPGDKLTILKIANGANVTLTGSFTATTPDIQSGGTLIIGAGAGDTINPSTKTLVVPSGATLKFTGSNRIQNDTVIDIQSGGTFDENTQFDTIGHIKGAGSITNLGSALTLSLPAVGSPSEFSGTISGTYSPAGNNSALVLRCDGTGASAASTLILSGANTGFVATGTNSTVNVQGGRLIGRNTAAFGPAGQIISVGAGALTLDPTIEFQTDAPMNSYVFNIGSGNTGTFELNRATPGAAFTQPAGTSTLGNGTLNFEKGANVTTGTPVLEFAALSLSAGSGGLGGATLNPVGVDITVLGAVTRPGASASNLKLDGTSTGNVISGVIQDNGANKLNVFKQNISTWTLEEANTYTGNTTISDGTLIVEQSNFADASTVTIGTTAGSAAVLNLPNAGTDIVTSLVIDGVTQLGDGAVYDSANSGGAITGSGKIQVGTPPSGYATWAGTNAGSQESSQDFDNDGVENGVEYFLNAAAGFTTSPSSFIGNTATWNNGGNIPSSAYGTQYVIQTSPDLVTWTDVLVGDPNLTNNSSLVSYALTIDTSKKFVRLRVKPN